jgi:hypothetical protein
VLGIDVALRESAVSYLAEDSHPTEVTDTLPGCVKEQ